MKTKRHAKKQENAVHNKKKKYKHIHRDVRISRKDFKITIINILNNLEEKVDKRDEKMKDAKREKETLKKDKI